MKIPHFYPLWGAYWFLQAQECAPTNAQMPKEAFPCLQLIEVNISLAVGSYQFLVSPKLAFPILRLAGQGDFEHTFELFIQF